MNALSRRASLAGRNRRWGLYGHGSGSCRRLRPRPGCSGVKAAVRQWHRAYDAYKRVELRDRQMMCDEAFYAREYGETVRAFLDADKEVSALAPATLAGAVALLSCHVAVQRDRAAAGRGEEVPSIVHYIHTHALVEDAFAALERLAPGVRS